MIVDSDEVAPGVVVDYSASGQLVSMDLNRFSKTLGSPFHCFDMTEPVGPFVEWAYEAAQDELTVFLTADKAAPQRVRTDEARIDIGTCDGGLWHSLHIRQASVFVCRPTDAGLGEPR